MKDLRRSRYRPRKTRPTDASRALLDARLRARLQIKQIAAALNLTARTVSRWEFGDAHPSKARWSQVVALMSEDSARSREPLSELHALRGILFYVPGWFRRRSGSLT